MGLLNNDVVQVTWRGECFGQRILLTHNYLILGDYNAATSVTQDLTDILNQVKAAGAFDVTTSYLACLAPDYTLHFMRAQRIKAIRSSYVEQVVAALPGTWAGAATVANDSAALTLRTASAGRSQRATKHIGPIADNASAAGLIVVGMGPKLTALGNKLIQAFAPAGSGSVVTPIIYHRGTGTFDVTDRFILGDQSRVQRRRTVGLGE